MSGIRTPLHGPEPVRGSREDSPAASVSMTVTCAGGWPDSGPAWESCGVSGRSRSRDEETGAATEAARYSGGLISDRKPVGQSVGREAFGPSIGDCFCAVVRGLLSISQIDMNKPMVDRNGSVFEWNTSGWFGGGIGASVPLLVGAFRIMGYSGWLAGVWLVAFTVAVTLAVVLWWQRERRSAYEAIQLLVGASGVCWFLAFASLLFTRPDLIPVISSRPRTAFQERILAATISIPALGLLPLLVFPALMVWFRWMNRRRVGPIHSE